MILYFTHNRKPREMTKRFYWHNRRQAERLGQRWIAIVAEQIGPGDVVVPFVDGPDYYDLYTRIMIGAGMVLPTETVYLCEDDMLYPDERFARKAFDPLCVCYNLNVISLCDRGYCMKPLNGVAMSQMWGSARGILVNVHGKICATLEGRMSCIEPCSGQVDGEYRSDTCRYPIASIDFRTAYNTTWSIGEDAVVFQNLDGWGSASELWDKYMKGWGNE